jgi:phage terminase large subunit-like protein
MILREPFLRQRAKFQATRKTMQVGNCRFQALSADVAGSFGSNPSFIVADEVAQYKDRKLWDAMTSGQGARKNARIVAISSAYQFDPESLIYELFTYACKVRDGIVEDDTFCPILYYLPLDKDWKDKSLWPKIMPALGDFCEEKFIEDEFKLALQMPTEEVKFRMLYLNQFLNNATPFIDMAAWDECREPPNPIGLCCGGLDMSSTTDLTAFALYFQDNSVKVWAWCPEDTVRKRVEGLRARYDIWIRQGLLKTTPGNTCDYDFIRRDINEISRQYSIAGIAVDPYNSTQMMTQLAADGFKVTSFRNSYVNMSSPIKQLQTLVLSKTLKHGGNPVLRWSASNLIVKQDSSGHLSPAKDKSTDSVDMMVACIMACGLFQSTPTSSCYDTGGLDYV